MNTKQGQIAVEYLVIVVVNLLLLMLVVGIWQLFYFSELAVKEHHLHQELGDHILDIVDQMYLYDTGSYKEDILSLPSSTTSIFSQHWEGKLNQTYSVLIVEYELQGNVYTQYFYRDNPKKNFKVTSDDIEMRNGGIVDMFIERKSNTIEITIN